MSRNPLTDELTPEAKAELAAVFADMKRRYQARAHVCEGRSTLPAVVRIRRTGW